MSKSIDPKYNYAFSQVFSPSLLKKIDDPIHEENFRHLLESSNLYPDNEQWNFLNGLEITYRYLKQNYRCEYIYMNEIANQLLLKFHNDNSATLLKELGSDCSIADIVIVNGNTVAYEIKTELDSFDRLAGQLESYKMLYDNVYVVTYPDAVDLLLKRIDKTIGVVVLNSNGKLETISTAEGSECKFNPAKAIYTLRQSELVAAYEKYVSDLPKMGTSLIYGYCQKWFLALEKEDARIIFKESLKSRKPSTYQFELIQKCSKSLKMLFYSKPLSKKFCISTLDRFGIF